LGWVASKEGLEALNGALTEALDKKVGKEAVVEFV